MTEARTTFLDWLRDAHAMEAQAETMLTSQIGRLAENLPVLTRSFLARQDSEPQAKR